MSLRFNLAREDDRKAWEYLQSLSSSRNKAVIEAINRLEGRDEVLARVIETTIRNCFKEISVVQTRKENLPQTLSVEENNLLASLEDFFGG